MSSANLAPSWSAPRFAETSFKADMIRRRVMMMTTETAASGGVGLGRGGRMSRKRKRDAVLRLLRGEDLETLSRALGVTAATLTGWQDTFVAAGEASLATRFTDGEALESKRLKAKLGEMLLERELLEAKIGALGGESPFGPPEVVAMSRTLSPSSGKPYGLARVCRVWRTARASVYRHLSSSRPEWDVTQAADVANEI